MSLRMWTVALSAYQIEDTKCKSPGCFKMLLLIDSQTAILSVCQQFVGVQCVHTLHTSYRLYPTFGVMWLALTRFFPACHYITFTWADSFAPCCFHPYLSLQPLRHERVIQAILTFVQDWLADLIDPCDPLQAFPTSSQDGCWFNRSLRRILSCISQDKRALIMKGKPRGFEASPPKQTSQHCWGGRGVFNLALCQH